MLYVNFVHVLITKDVFLVMLMTINGCVLIVLVLDFRLVIFLMTMSSDIHFIIFITLLNITDYWVWNWILLSLMTLLMITLQMIWLSHLLIILATISLIVLLMILMSRLTIRVSKNGIFPSFTSSYVNLMELVSSILFRCSVRSLTASLRTTSNMSSTYLFHSLGLMFIGTVAMAVSSRCSMKMSAARGETELSIAAPNSCL